MVGGDSRTVGSATESSAQRASGHREAVDHLFRLHYEALREVARRRLRHEPADQALAPTALVHEIYLRLVERPNHRLDRSNFLAVARRTMHHVLVDHARRKRARKRGGHQCRTALDHTVHLSEGSSVDTTHMTEILSALAALNQRAARLVELRFSGGLTSAEAAGVLGLSLATIEREWRFARGWLRRRL